MLFNFMYCSIKMAFTSILYLRKLKKHKNIEQKNTEVIEEVSLEAYYFLVPELIGTFLLSCRCTTSSDQFPTLRHR